MGLQGIVTIKLFQRDKMRRGILSDCQDAQEIHFLRFFGVFFAVFFDCQTVLNTSKHTLPCRHPATPFGPRRQDGTSLPPGVCQNLDFRRPSGQR